MKNVTCEGVEVGEQRGLCRDAHLRDWIRGDGAEYVALRQSVNWAR